MRFIQLYHRGWDHHGGVKRSMEITAGEVDRPTGALLTDLARRGLLEDTLVIWGGEFGRTPMGQGSGRDHHIKGFSLWLAGGGIAGGTSYGATDELGYAAVDRPVHVTTCTRRCCTCSGSTTSGSCSASRVGTTA